MANTASTGRKEAAEPASDGPDQIPLEPTQGWTLDPSTKHDDLPAKHEVLGDKNRARRDDGHNQVEQEANEDHGRCVRPTPPPGVRPRVDGCSRTRTKFLRRTVVHPAVA